MKKITKKITKAAQKQILKDFQYQVRWAAIQGKDTVLLSGSTPGWLVDFLVENGFAVTVKFTSRLFGRPSVKALVVHCNNT